VYVTWIGKNIAAPSSLVIAVFFWTLLYKASSGSPSALDINSHGGTFIIMCVDVFLSAAPFRLLHLWCVGCFAAAYWVFYTAYFFITGTSIYPILNFHHTLTSIILTVLVFFVVLPIAVVFFWLIKLLEVRIFAPKAASGTDWRDDDYTGDFGVLYPDNTRIQNTV
jgi:hypothetical protein